MKKLITTAMAAVILSATSSGKVQNSDFERIISYAIKAPSGHNTQPWTFNILESSIEIHPDFQMRLPVVDPNNRELYISLGCAAENLCIAAREFDYDTRFSVENNESNIPFINIILTRSELQKDPLFYHIEKRQTNRSVYQGRIIPRKTIDSLLMSQDATDVMCFEKGSLEFNHLRDLIQQANTIQMNDNEFKRELLQWIRFNQNQVNKHQNGLSYKVNGMPATPGFLGKAIVNSFLSPGKQNTADMEKVDSSSHLALFCLEQNDPYNWIWLGRKLQRFLLETTQLGISHAYMNQPCEVEEMAAKMQTTLGLQSRHPVLLLRIGYADAMPYSPRRELNTVIRKERNL